MTLGASMVQMSVRFTRYCSKLGTKSRLRPTFLPPSGISDLEKCMGSKQNKKCFRNIIKSNRNLMVFTIFRLIWNLTDVRLVPNHSGNGKYNLILIRFNNILKRFLCVYGRGLIRFSLNTYSRYSFTH